MKDRDLFTPPTMIEQAEMFTESVKAYRKTPSSNWTTQGRQATLFFIEEGDSYSAGIYGSSKQLESDMRNLNEYLKNRHDSLE